MSLSRKEDIFLVEFKTIEELKLFNKFLTQTIFLVSKYNNAMEIKYTRQGDYLIPNLYLDKDEDYEKIGKYEMLRLHFIAKIRKHFMKHP